MTWLIRRYRSGEETELWNLFYHTVRNVNCRDYTEQQVRAWAPDDFDVVRWRARIEGINPDVCIYDRIIVGYADLQESGLIDHFYVHHARQRQGVGTRLMEHLESQAHANGIVKLTSHVSITAKPFFIAHGFQIVHPQDVTLGSVVLRNYKMMKQLK